MTLIGPTVFIGIATSVLAVGSLVAAVYAIRAFGKQSTSVTDGRELISQQREMLQVQADRLEVYRRQVDDQREMNDQLREMNVARIGTLELQAQEIRASLEQRERAAEQERRSQAEKVTAWFGEERHGIWGAKIRNASGLPVLDVRVSFYYIAERSPGGEWEPVHRGSPPEKIRVVPPQADRFFPIPDQIMSMMDQVNDDVYAVGIRFTDAAGNYWERDPRGALISQT